MAAIHSGASLQEIASWYWSGTSSSVGRVEGVAVLDGRLMLVAFMLLITFGVFVSAER